jgi:hypothetical protein
MPNRVCTLLALSLFLPATAFAQLCDGDCANDGAVTVDEVVTGVNLALGAAPLSQCNPFDRDADGSVTVDEVIAAINNALTGCPAAPAQSLSGVAATGAPIVGQVCAVGGNGAEIGCSATAVDGSFRIGTVGASGPFLLSAIPTFADAPPQFSWSNVNDGLTNVTPFTTLALLLATDYADLRDLYEGWGVGQDSVDQEVLADAVDAVLGNFANRLSGAVPNGFDPFTSFFAANGTGFDAVLDALNFDFDFDGGNVFLNGSTFVIDFDPGVIPDGNYRLTIRVEVSVAPPQTIVIDNVPKPTTSGEFCTPELYGEAFANIPGLTINSCSFDGTSGRIAATVSPAPGFSISYTATYTYSPMP